MTKKDNLSEHGPARAHILMIAAVNNAGESGGDPVEAIFDLLVAAVTIIRGFEWAETIPDIIASTLPDVIRASEEAFLVVENADEAEAMAERMARGLHS